MWEVTDKISKHVRKLRSIKLSQEMDFDEKFMSSIKTEP